MKNEQRLPLDCVYILLQLGEAMGEGRRMRTEEMYTLLTLLGSKNISRGLS